MIFDALIKQALGNVDPEQFKTASAAYLEAVKMRLGCLWDETSRTRLTLEAVYGRAPGARYERVSEEEGGGVRLVMDEQYAPRNMATAPVYIEDESADGTLAVVDIDIIGDLGRYSPGGGITNLGADEFRAVITAADGTTTRPVSVPADVTLVIDFFFQKVQIVPLTGLKARYQIKAN
jgi:hypothetical protein